VIRVLVVDDHRLVRAGLITLLEAAGDIEVVGEAADGRQALEAARSARLTSS
jgi:DNA-binding NarL/FixJ family response regulator